VRISGALARGLVVLGFAVASLVLGYLGLSVYASHHPGLGFGQGPADIFYDDLQLFVLSAPLTSTGTLPVALQVARFLAPGTTILAGVETLRVLLGEHLRSLAAARAARHAIVTGDGPAALSFPVSCAPGTARSSWSARPRPRWLRQGDTACSTSPAIRRTPIRCARPGWAARTSSSPAPRTAPRTPRPRCRPWRSRGKAAGR
jgi:hypothetical protein